MLLGTYSPGDVIRVRCKVGEHKTVTRPGVVLSRPDYHDAFGELVVMPIVTGNEVNSQWSYKLKDWQLADTGGLAAVLQLIRVVDGRAAGQKIGQLSNRDRERIEYAVMAGLAGSELEYREEDEEGAAGKEVG